MSIRSCTRSRLGCFLLVSILSSSVVAEEDPVVRYYWDKTHNVYKSRDLVASGISYELVATTYLKHLGRRAEVERIDSATVRYYCRSGQIDSQVTINGDDSRFRDIDLVAANIFELQNYLFLFPNDTGGVELAIGFESDSGSVDPTGMVIIDRYRYLPRRLYLHYSSVPGYRRLSRSFRFAEVDGYIYPDSIWEVGSKQGVFAPEEYRLETVVDSVKRGR